MPPLTPPIDGVSRRHALRLMAAATALAGLGGCDGEPEGRLIPAVVAPPGIVAGMPGYYATASVLDGYASGVVLTHQMGRPIKVEGNKLHPASLGATSATAQAEILDFYDPDRAGGILRHDLPSDRAALLTALGAVRQNANQSHGAGLRILTGSVTSPTLAAQLQALLAAWPDARWHQWDAISRDNPRAGATLAYGRPAEMLPRLAQADVVFGIDSDLIETAPGALRFARDLAARRNPTRTQKMSRIYAVEPTPSLLGVMADHRVVADAAQTRAAATTLADVLLHGGSSTEAPPWLQAAITDLSTAHGRCFVHAGPTQPPELHALVHAINEKLGGRGTTYELIDPIVAAPTDQAASLQALIGDMDAGRVTALLILDNNPVFTVPATWGFAEALPRVPFSLTLTVASNETSARTTWSVPQSHAYEAWSDARAYDGSATILQPQALPLYGGISAHRLLALLSDPSPPKDLHIVQQTWRDRLSGDFDVAWHRALADGLVPGTTQPGLHVALRDDVTQVKPPPLPSQPLTLHLRPDPYLWDGRNANNAWLQELPRPLTKLTWDNPLCISPSLAKQRGLANGDLVRLTVGDRHVDLPVWLLPGQAPNALTASLGFGRTDIGEVGRGVGSNLFPLTHLDAAPTLQKLDRSVAVACTDRGDPFDPAGQDAARHATLAAFQRNPHIRADVQPAPSLYRRKPPGPAEWAMSIDLNACIGCNACVIACQAENNVPVVGKAQVLRQREMHWLRIDRYHAGDPAAPGTVFQPMLCQHCEQAPCETVCPVGATTHDAEGLNVMVYNRCVGTRFCSNNCPYKVRRFNYDAFAHDEHRPRVARNPDVSVRARGVMEKCTFCLQRIAQARIVADRDDRPIGAQEVRTACQAACPTQAISFGNIAAPDCDVATRQQSPLTYAALPEQQTLPRVTYEARIRNTRSDLA